MNGIANSRLVYLSRAMCKLLSVKKITAKVIDATDEGRKLIYSGLI